MYKVGVFLKIRTNKRYTYIKTNEENGYISISAPICKKEYEKAGLSRRFMLTDYSLSLNCLQVQKDSGVWGSDTPNKLENICTKESQQILVDTECLASVGLISLEFMRFTRHHFCMQPKCLWIALRLI